MNRNKVKRKRKKNEKDVRKDLEFSFAKLSVK